MQAQVLQPQDWAICIPLETPGGLMPAQALGSKPYFPSSLENDVGHLPQGSLPTFKSVCSGAGSPVTARRACVFPQCQNLVINLQISSTT